MKDSLFSGAIVLALGAFVSKLLGAIYKIPLTFLIGTEGIGRYQMVYPTYLLLLTFSSVGIPSSIARLTARGVNPLKTAFSLFLPIGICFSVLMALLSFPLSLLQGEKGLFLGYLALSPAVAFVSGIAVLRGYFQGKNNMVPTAVSEIIESSIRVGVGLLFAYLFRDRLDLAIGGILLGVTLGEGVAFCYLLTRKREKNGAKMGKKSLIFGTIPLMISASILPFSSFLDSFVLTQRMGVSSFGLLTGCALVFVSLPASLSYGIGCAVLPRIASGRKEIGKAVGLTLLLSVPAFFFLLLFPKSVLLVFHVKEKELLVSFVRLLSPVALLLPLVETLSSCLAGLKRTEGAILSLLLGITVKLGFQLFSTLNEAISFDLCYLVAFFFELEYIVVCKEKKYDHDRWFRYAKRRLDEGRGRGDFIRRANPLENGTCRIFRERKVTWGKV